MLYRRVFEQSSSGCQREDKKRMAIKREREGDL